jgi:hypothetical protein
MVHSLMAIGGWLGLGVAPFLTRKTDSNTIRIMIYIASPPVVAFVLTAVFTVLYGIGYFTNQVLTIMVRPENIRTVAANMSVIIISFTGAVTISDIFHRIKQDTIDIGTAAENVGDVDSEHENEESQESEHGDENEESQESEHGDENEESQESEHGDENEESQESEHDDENEESEHVSENGDQRGESEESNSEWKKTADFDRARNAPPLTDKEDE